MQDTLQFTQEIQNILKANEANVFDLIGAFLGFFSVSGLILTVWYQYRTYHESKELALLDRRAKKAEYMPDVKLELDVWRDNIYDELTGNWTAVEISDRYFSFKATVTKNTIVRPFYIVESNIEGFKSEIVDLDQDSYWSKDDEISVSKIGQVDFKIDFMRSESPTFVRCEFYFRDMLGNLYYKCVEVHFPRNGIAMSGPIKSLD